MKSLSQLNGRNGAFQGSDFDNVGFGKLVREPPFPISVVAVHCVGTEKKVVGPDATRVVAGMKDQNRRLNPSKMQYPRVSVDEHFLSVKPTEPAVIPFVDEARPIPATVRFFNSTPKALLVGVNVGKKWVSHFGLSFSSICLGQSGCDKLDCPIFSLSPHQIN